MRAGGIVLVVIASTVALGCTSPEASRMRGGGPGGDPGNRTEVVRMHEGSLPYHDTPRLIQPWGLDDLQPARQAYRLSKGESAPGEASANPTSDRR